MMGDFAAADRANARLIEIATSLNAPFWKTVGHFLEGKLLIDRGEFWRGAAVLREAFRTCGETGWRVSYPEFRGALAIALAGLEHLDEALTAVTEALEGADQRGSVVAQPTKLRLRVPSFERKAAVAPYLQSSSSLGRQTIGATTPDQGTTVAFRDNAVILREGARKLRVRHMNQF